ncbi:MAG: ATP-binding cassette domain-containing protein [Succinivibrio sp.]|nr:ATP-binding cassette domain-containing protein [Succinivibrio sp.]MBR1612023.1 ATP-binding cassette domain-containing protein [Succinivibrio sp.]
MKKNKKTADRLDVIPEVGSLTPMQGMKKFWPFLKPYFFWTVVGILLTIPVGGLDAAVASFLKPFMDNVMVEKDNEFAQIVPMIIVGFTLIQGICIYSSNLVNSFVGNRIATNIKLALYKKLLVNDVSFFDKNTSGIILLRFCNDAEAATSGLINNVKLFLSKFWSSVGLVCVLLYQSWALSLIALGVLFFLAVPMKIARKKLMKLMSCNVKAITKINTTYVETYSGIRIIKSFNLQNTMFNKFMGEVEEVFKFSMKIIRDTNWLSPAMHLVTSIGVAGVLYFGLYLITTPCVDEFGNVVMGENGKPVMMLTAGAFVAFLAALIMLYTPIKSIGNNYIALQQSLLALERIYEILDGYSFENNDGKGTKTLEKIEKDITFKDVNFSYDGQRMVLKNVNLTVPVGSKVALVGNSGGGKSTVCSLIPRLYEIDEGEITIDGVDIDEYTLSSLRGKISMVFQDNFLFDGSVRDNLMYGNADATDEEIDIAIKSAYLDEFVKKLPNGLDTLIGERGLLLSGGQKQRLAIARAILKNSPVVILDEATSALDNKSEKVVQRALDKLMEGKTTIVIAHRLSTVMDADKILVINDGEVVEQGTHDELLAMNGAYSVLYNSQFSKAKEEGENEDAEAEDVDAVHFAPPVVEETEEE